MDRTVMKMLPGILKLRKFYSISSSGTRHLSTSNHLFTTVKPHPNEARKQNDDDDELDDTPIKYSTSKAAQWKAAHSFRPPSDDAPPIQGPLVLLSTAVFMMYFCVIREENDLDENLYRPLEETVPGIQRPSHE